MKVAALFRGVALVVGTIALVLAGLILAGRLNLSIVIPQLLFVVAGGLLAGFRRIS